jgi:glycogen debranching enzyme
LTRTAALLMCTLTVATAPGLAEEPDPAGAAAQELEPDTPEREEPHAQPMPAEFQEQAEKRIAEYEPRLRRLVRTEDPALNRLVEQIYRECVYGKLFEPMPPELPYRWFAPGGAYFTGQWIWDTMFVLIAFAPLDDDAVVRESFDNYRYTIENNPLAPEGSVRYGMVPNFMGARELRDDGKAWPPVGYSQIPILGWGALSIYRQTNDRELLEQVLPWLVAFDEWYSTERDVDGDGLIEYGAYETVGPNTPVQTARFETFDFHLPLDDMKLTAHPRRETGGEWYGDVEGVEQTSFLLMSERALIEIATELGKGDLARRYQMTIARRVEAMQRKMWDPKTRFFYSLERDSDERIMVRTPQGFLPLTAGAATAEQGAELARQIQDPDRWWTDYPIPTIARDEPEYDPKGYWRGDMWPPTTYLVALGLSRYGHHDLALELTLRLKKLIEDKGISEHYHGETGEPLGVPGLGMSGVVWSMIVHSLYGVQEDYRTIRVPRGAAGRSLTLGKLVVAYPEDEVVEVTSGFDRSIRVVFPAEAGAGEPRVTVGDVPWPADSSENDVRFVATEGETYRVERSPSRP